MARSSTSGQGRPKGARNKATADVKELAQKHGPSVVRELARLAIKAESEQARVAAGKEILDRAYGKAPQTMTLKDARDVRDLTEADLLAIASGNGAAGAETGEVKPAKLH